MYADAVKKLRKNASYPKVLEALRWNRDRLFVQWQELEKLIDEYAAHGEYQYLDSTRKAAANTWDEYYSIHVLLEHLERFDK
jgi:hypothetical protein